MVYRSSMRITADLLAHTKESGAAGIRATSLISKANLSHSRLVKMTEHLTGKGLINRIEYDGRHAFVITPRGRQYLEQYEKFAAVAESFGLEM